MYRFLMASRIALAAFFAWYLLHTSQAILLAVTASVLLHHFRMFDTTTAPRTGWEKAFYCIAGTVSIGAVLFYVGAPWLMTALQIALAVLWAVLIPGAISYLFERDGELTPACPCNKNGRGCTSGNCMHRANAACCASR